MLTFAYQYVRFGDLIWAKQLVHFLGDLVGPEAKGSTCAINDDIRTEATKDTCLVVFARLEVGDNGIVRVR
ncbi:hypothetical protein RRF57_000215 [Xylaria bambusicola]|uniref:Uncharacterized protein n=1 Tax=Xylaria bambusicola TaxID=326684 RepID=A0AAN7UN76_9PEZI